MYELEPDPSNGLRKGAKICGFRDELYELKCRIFYVLATNILSV